MVESFTINRIPHEIRVSQREALHFRNASPLIFAHATDRRSRLALTGGNGEQLSPVPGLCRHPTTLIERFGLKYTSIENVRVEFFRETSLPPQALREIL